MANPEHVTVEVAYATPACQRIITVVIPSGTRVGEAIRASGIGQEFPEIDLARMPVGVFSRPCSLDDPVRGGERIEIYRPLIADPKQARRARAAKKG